MKILSSFLYSINQKKHIASEISIEKNKDISNYIDNLIEEISNNPNKKQFKIRDKNTQVISILLKSIDSGSLDHENTQSIANRLLTKEKEQQELVDKLNIQIKKGSLCISLLEEKDYYTGLLVKVDSSDFLDENESIKKSGLPYENKSFKECVIKIRKETKEIEKIYLYDRNGKIADYWSNKFLELDELITAEVATKKSFNIINNILKNSVNKQSPSDYVLLRNQSLGYFKTQTHFNIDDYFEKVFGGYLPENDKVNVEIIKHSIQKKLPDTSFTIVPAEIKNKKISMTKKVNDIVEININGYDVEIKDKIRSKEIAGRRVIEIEATDTETFDSFNWK
ncbi:MAG: hypothetical protein P1P64_04695 [Treponemataceae bacterium]